VSRLFMRHVSWCLVVLMVVIGITPKVEAGFFPSEPISSETIRSRTVPSGMLPSGVVPSEMITSSKNEDRAADLQKIQKALELKMVRERLEKLGFSQEEIQSRLSQIDNQQIHQLALKLDDLRTGGDGLEVVIGILIIGILVVILLHLTGHKVIVSQR
jgi:hypothetical protein